MSRCQALLLSVSYDHCLEGLKTFLPNAKCLGDVLKENDYKNIFINGVSLNFVGTGLFFKNHVISNS